MTLSSCVPTEVYGESSFWYLVVRHVLYHSKTVETNLRWPSLCVADSLTDLRFSFSWNGTAENSRDSYFRASEAGLECIETDIHLSLDNQLPMIHDNGLGRTTDIGEQTNQSAYNPFSGKGYNPRVANLSFTGEGGIGQLHLRDESGRVRDETVPTLPDMIGSIHDSGMNVVLQLDFKEEAAVAPAYWALKNLTNAAGVPANEWCIYKLQASWYNYPEEFEELDWVKDAFASGVQLAFIPVYNPIDEVHFNTTRSLEEFLKTNYTISAEIELHSPNGPLQNLQTRIEQLRKQSTNQEPVEFRTSGTFYAIGDFVTPVTSPRTFFDTFNYSLPRDERVNNTVYAFQEHRAPVLQDSLVGNASTDGHDYRSNMAWILGEQRYNWVILDTADEWDVRLRGQGKRNIEYMLRDGASDAFGQEALKGWYRRSAEHARDFRA
jgi:hypothetical protein